MVSKRPGEDDSVNQPEPESKRLRGEQANGLQPIQIYPKGLELPSGWLDCPPIGHRIEALHVVPAKVPLGRRFGQILTEEQHFSPEKLIHQLRAKGLEVGLIIDLTNSWRYYDLEEVSSLGVAHLKIMCRGRGKAPEPQAVNQFVWELCNFTSVEANRDKWVVVHCTHGYNRTGFMIVSMFMRLGCSLAWALGSFRHYRPNGIYKEDYIRTLYEYYHEPLPASFQAPALPAWKPEEPDSPKVDHDLDAEENGGEQEELRPLQHDDAIGEEVSFDEAQMVCESIIRQVRGVLGDDAVPDPWRTFPGSQPVSLDRQNLSLLHRERYWVTWKADGTRYMLLIMRLGTYLVDRSFKVRRLQMRFPLHLMRSPEYQSHHMTLLDGELIVDEDRETGKHTYRYLAYDAMAINGVSLVNRPWKERWQAVEDGVLKMRQRERFEIEKDLAAGLNRYPVHYQYQSELVRMLRKGFFPLWQAKKLLLDVIPTLSHESDGLIFQAYDEPYVVGTDEKLLKWKYGNMNSVDFLLRSKAAGPELYLGKGSDIVLLPGAKVEFNEGEDVRQYENCIVECSWDGDDGVWRFMRVRTDKQLPNAKHVYEKVLASIKDNIEQEDVIAEVEQAMKSSVYEKDRLQMPVR